MRARHAALVAPLLPRIADIRRLGSAALDLCFLAAGRLDGYFEAGPEPVGPRGRRPDRRGGGVRRRRAVRRAAVPGDASWQQARTSPPQLLAVLESIAAAPRHGLTLPAQQLGEPLAVAVGVGVGAAAEEMVRCAAARAAFTVRCEATAVNLGPSATVMVGEAPGTGQQRGAREVIGEQAGGVLARRAVADLTAAGDLAAVGGLRRWRPGSAT